MFLKSKKTDNYYLAIIPAKDRLNLKELELRLNDKIGFASESELKNILDLTPGAVSPFSLINDKENQVTLVISKQVLDSDIVSFHPNINTETLELKQKDFQSYLDSIKNKKIIFWFQVLF